MRKTKNIRRRLVATLWFVPSVMAIAGCLLGLIIVAADFYLDKSGAFLSFFNVQPSAARDMLSVVAGSMITVAGTVFSITIVALTLASTQFSPRILRNFIGDLGNQVVLGAFVGIFAYCIVVLRTIREDDSGLNFVPSFAVATGIAFGLSGIGFLIYFIHHVATTIQATSIISQIAAETIREIDDKYPKTCDVSEFDPEVIQQLRSRNWIKIESRETGYIQNADTDELFEIAKRENLVVQMRRRVGEFTIKGLPLLQISPCNADFRPNDHLAGEFNAAYEIDNFRTVEGDVAFGIRQIVDIALRALSPAINDTTTAISCVDYLTAILVELARRPSHPPLHFEGDDLFLFINQQRFEDFFDLAYNQIRQNSGKNVAIILRLLNALEILGKTNQRFEIEAERKERHDLIENQATILREIAERTIVAKSDLESALKRFEKVRETLEGLR